MRKNLYHRGCTLAYDIVGSGQSVIFIQGIGAHGSAWNPQIIALKEEYTCLSFDNRGIGESLPVGVSPLTVEQMADDVIALMDAQGWAKSHIVGHSLGGLVAQLVALRATDRVLSLALLNSFAIGRSVAPMTARMFWWGMRSAVGTRAMRRYAFLRLVWSPAELDACDWRALGQRLHELIGHDLGQRPPIVPHQLSAMRRANTANRLSALADVPTLILSARHDMLATPVLGRALAQAIPGATYHEYTDASHAAPIQCTDRVNRLLLEHLQMASQRSVLKGENC